MKKIFPIIILLIIPLILSAQWYGDGLSAVTAYYGVINSSYTMQPWNTTNYPGGVIYVGQSATGQNDLEIGSGGTLTISEGITVKFCTTASDLRITGTGVLSASGSSSSYVTFTKDAQATWGHISFEASTGSSVIDYCIIEYGRKTGAGIEGYGGGIHANTNTLTITNSTIRNNYALFGGGLFVNQSRYPAISNCYVYNNQSLHAGGGFYFWNSSSSVVTNCLFDSNQCLESSVAYYTGGGLAAQQNCAIKVINCTFINNTSTRPEGQALLFHSSPNSRAINSIFWGSPLKQIYCYGSTPASVIINCAYRGITYPSGTPVNPIVLNSSNNALDGPNFTAIDGTNWSLQFISPCRDAGATPSPTVPNDFIGNSRIGPYDIGAYEVQYSRWRTDASDPTSWTTAGNWEQGFYPGLAGTTGDVIIPNLTNAAYAPNISGTTTINAGKSMILEPGAKATFGTLTNNGTLKLNSTASGNASLILTTYTKGAGSTEEIQLFLTGGGTKTPLTYKWHYISSPVTSLAVSTFAPAYTLNVAQWVQDRPSTSLMQGWVAYDGYIYSTGGSTGPTFSSFTPGKGYDYFKTTDYTYTFGGQLNTGDVNASLSYKTGNDNLYGYNLIGNPFSSGLDWDYITTHSFPANTTKTLYFTRNSILCSYVAGVSVPGDVNGIIPPMQGFFSKTHSTGVTIVLAAAARTHNNIHPTYKGSKSLIPLVRLALADSLLTDETVVRFDDLAKSYLDNDFDAVKMFLDPSLSSIHTSLDGTDYAINGLPFPETLIEIPVTINIATGEETKSITASQLQGLDNYTITLTDNSTGFVADLRTTPTVTFAAAKGSVAGRFILKISAVTTGVETPVITNNKFNIYPANNSINIQTIADEWEGKSGTVRLMDLTGKTISNLQNTEFHKNSLTQVASPAAKGIYVVEIRAGNMRYVGKVVIH